MDQLEHYIEAIKQRDETAFEYIYNETKQGTFALILSIVRDRSLAEDVMQDTYMKMIASIHQYQYGKSFRNWLLSIAKNQAIDYYRRRKHEKLTNGDDLDALEGNQSSGNEFQLEFNELLNLLSQEEREVVVLRIVENMKHQDIAEVLNKKVGTVMWLYHNAVQKMKKYRKE